MLCLMSYFLYSMNKGRVIVMMGGTELEVLVGEDILMSRGGRGESL